MDNMYRDDVTRTLEGYYSRRVFFGDITIDEVPKDIHESAEKDLKSSCLFYLCE